jgi:hypothetical protein
MIKGDVVTFVGMDRRHVRCKIEDPGVDEDGTRHAELIRSKA